MASQSYTDARESVRHEVLERKHYSDNHQEQVSLLQGYNPCVPLLPATFPIGNTRKATKRLTYTRECH